MSVIIIFVSPFVWCLMLFNLICGILSFRTVICRSILIIFFWFRLTDSDETDDESVRKTHTEWNYISNLDVGSVFVVSLDNVVVEKNESVFLLHGRRLYKWPKKFCSNDSDFDLLLKSLTRKSEFSTDKRKSELLTDNRKSEFLTDNASQNLLWYCGSCFVFLEFHLRAN